MDAAARTSHIALVRPCPPRFAVDATAQIERRQVLGGLISEYHSAATNETPGQRLSTSSGTAQVSLGLSGQIYEDGGQHEDHLLIQETADQRSWAQVWHLTSCLDQPTAGELSGYLAGQRGRGLGWRWPVIQRSAAGVQSKGA
jgi:hypothetical protein